jgi:MFS-type transporter involved in bile tolerance (Atg22 family)
MIQQKTKSSITLITLIIATIVVKSQSKSHLLDKQLKNRLIESPTNRPFFSVISKPLRSNHLNQNVYKSHYNTNIISLERGGHDDDEIKVEHHTNPKLMFLIKLLFIAYYSSLGALMPYLPVYYHSLGHSGQAIGLLGAVKPLTTFLVAPLWGIISDYYQKPGFIMQLTFISSLILQLLLPLNDSVHYLVAMVFITAVFNAPVKSLIDSMVMDKLNKDDRGQYGRLRLYGQLGFGLGSSIVGTFITNRSFVPVAPSSAAPSPELNQFIQGTMEVIEEVGAASAASEQSTKTAIETLSFLLQSSIEKLTNMRGYKLAFVAYGIMSIPAFLAMKAFQRFDSGEATPKNNEAKSRVKGSPRILQGINMLLHNADAMLFFFLVLIVGITSGIIENFAYVRLREVGGTGKEMGICRLVSSLSGAPMFWFSGPLTEKLGADRVLVLSLISYIFRFLNYAFMKNPYHALPAEALRGVAFAAFWSTGTVFAHKISPPGMSATMLLFMNAMYGGLGQSIGAIGGGKLQSKVGTVNTFIYSAAADFLFVIFVTIYLSLRKDSNFRNPQQIQIVKS